jgi:hypothetical protein
MNDDELDQLAELLAPPPALSGDGGQRAAPEG